MRTAISKKEADVLFRNLPEAPNVAIDVDGGDERERENDALVARGLVRRSVDHRGTTWWETTELGRALLLLYRTRTRRA